MASDRAKELAAKQKAEAQAEKERKRTSDDPKDWGKIRQFTQAFKLTREMDKALIWLMIAGFLVTLGLFIALSFIMKDYAWMYPIFGVAFGLLTAMYVLSWRAKGAMFKRYKDQPGAGEIGLNLLPKSWIKNPVIAVNRYQDSVHRVVGPPGIVLIGDGQAGRVREMLATETKRHEAIKYKVPVTSLVLGEASNQVPLNKLDKHIKKLPKAIKPSQVTEITARLKALDGARPRLPIPKGPMPTMKGARSALRGR